MALFLFIVLSVYGLINAYIFLRGWQALAGATGIRLFFAIVFILSTLAYPIGRTALSLGKDLGATFLIRIGNFHIAIMLYLFLAVVLIDLFRLFNAFTPFFPGFITSRPEKTIGILFWCVIISTAAVVIGGYVNTFHPKVRRFQLEIHKNAGRRDTLTVALASDIHLGVMIGASRLEKIVRRINALEPDIVLLAGDIVDESMTADVEDRLTEAFKDVHAPLGIFAVPGNHEFYSGLERNLSCLRRCGLRVLQDEAVLVDEAFYVIGRKDPSALSRGESRIPVRRILETGEVERGLPLILLDHQPRHLDEAKEAGIDLQLSGHTHAGQLFPLNIINKLIWEQHWGYLQKGDTHYYVSCGISTWGPRVRTGSVPEIVHIHITFDKRP